MRAKHITAAILGAASLALAGCGQQAQQQDETAGVAATEGPQDAPGVPQAELDTRQAVNDLGTAARSLVEATDVAAARDAVGTLEQNLASQSKELPEEIASGVKADLERARTALGTDDLATAKAAGTAIIDRMRTSAAITDPTLVQPAGAAGQASPTPTS